MKVHKLSGVRVSPNLEAELMSGGKGRCHPFTLFSSIARKEESISDTRKERWDFSQQYLLRRTVALRPVMQQP